MLAGPRREVVTFLLWRVESVLPLKWMHVLAVAQLALVALIIGLADTFYSSAETAALKRVMPYGQLGQAPGANCVLRWVL